MYIKPEADAVFNGCDVIGKEEVLKYGLFRQFICRRIAIASVLCCAWRIYDVEL